MTLLPTRIAHRTRTPYHSRICGRAIFKKIKFVPLFKTPKMKEIDWAVIIFVMGNMQPHSA